MALHFYINGTAGAKDGTMLSGGDLSSCLTTEGFEVASGVNVSKTYDVCVRADEGEVWKFCPINVVSDSTNVANYFIIDSAEYLVYSTSGMYIYGYFEITDVNKVFKVKITVNGSNTNTPDTTSKLMVGGVRVV